MFNSLDYVMDSGDIAININHNPHLLKFYTY